MFYNKLKSKSTTEVTLDGQKTPVDSKGEVKTADFTVKTSGQPLLSGIVTQPVSIKQTHKGSELSGSVDEILKMLSSPGFNT